MPRTISNPEGIHPPPGAGRFHPLIDRVFTLEELGEAHRLMDEGQFIGKAIVKP